MSKQQQETLNTMSNGAKAFDIHTYIPFRLVVAQTKMHASLRPESAEGARAIAELSQTEFRILVLLASKGPMQPSAVAEEYGFDRAMVTRALSSLAKKGLLTNERQESNQRSKIAVLTEKGREYAQVEFSVLEHYGQHLDKALNKGEKAKLFEILDKLLIANEQFEP